MNTLDLRRALQACLPHVADPEAYPALAVLHFVATDENLFVTGANTISLGHAVVSMWDHRDLTGDPDTDCFDLSPATAKELLTVFKSGGAPASEDGVGECLRRITVTEDKVSVLDVSGLFPGKAFTVPRETRDEYRVGFARMLLECLTADSVVPARLAVAGAVVKWFTTAALAYRAPLMLEPTADERRILISCGDSFLGILMPIRSGDESELAQDTAIARHGWLHRLVPLRDHGAGKARQEAH
ncbi:hypothetical protein [Sinomonas sp. ASV322]|uniref:hypothetical protein n=1 Tax=Sinomonas sp. ASV322 TaxID=3041920 RepID=UPI0027DC2551|nr:hypothetical protein [Sinomonas sp. ASV322]MDQ4502164.1 hypothetical protein [Sinomonas sp. ASV322]